MNSGQRPPMLTLGLDGQPLTTQTTLVEGQWAEFGAVPPEDATLALEADGVVLDPFLRPGAPDWRWRWRAPAAVGSHELKLTATWPDGGEELLRVMVRVAPRKIDQERYVLLLADLQQVGRALVFALAGGTEGVTADGTPDPAPPTPAEELHLLFGNELDRLASAVERLARRLPERTEATTVQTEVGRLRSYAELRQVRPEAQRQTPTGAEDAAALTAGLTTLPERIYRASYDSYETRLLRRLLDSLWRRSEHLAAPGALPVELAPHIAQARERLRELRGLAFLAGVPALERYTGPTARIQRDPDYRVVYRMWRLLRRRPLVTWDATTLSIAIGELPRLYERWCAARVALALLELPGYTPAAQAILSDTEEDRLLALPEDRPLVVLEAQDGTRLSLRYHPRYRPSGRVLRSLDRHTRVPDLAIELERSTGEPAVIVLDAKYRLDGTGGVPEEALADAYSYLGAIGGVAGARATRGSALLYPGQGHAEVYPSGVAALPLLPGAEGALRSWLSEILGPATKRG